MSEMMQPKILTTTRRPAIIAHRGLSWAYPENTLSAFRAAEAAGADLIELDFHTTRDGPLVCVHDETLDRYLTADSPLMIRGKRILSLLKSDIQSLDVGTWKHADFAGTRVPLLAEALNFVKAPILVERKTGSVEQLIEVLNETGSMDRVVVQSFDWVFLAKLHEQQTGLSLVALGEGPFSVSLLHQAQASGAVGIHWSHAILPTDIEAIHAAGMFIWVYTLNTQPDFARAIAAGVDGITTDRCDLASTWL